ncbi:outer membrane protein [Bradyrhizobium betae]|uniref:Porin family protein n=1 Tax=Bradyrhizobium betae TaxID=244734 RepID=A0A5P6NZ32_9BRAD|nr:outer membrane beta-barrel protein [Bradyrhizobium betae]MCS3725309.1 outer membrane immunogenic protein [Bradyrhizobium betae]QFI71369.1 porin family protein [Bradyrhizobium betae]
MHRALGFAAILSSLALAIGLPAHAADMPLKAPPITALPSWTGFYVGGQIGGGWSDRTVTYVGNDPIATLLVNGGLGAVGEQPFASHRVNISGVTGGLEAGYNLQIDRSWVIGVEADFSGSDIKGSGSGTSVLATAAPGFFTQTVAGQEKIDWWGTVRARLGVLATPDLLLYGTAGFAYGRVMLSDSYVFNGAPPAGLLGDLAGRSFLCAVNVTCFSGSTSSVKTGWTAGAGGEWRWTHNWTVKAEYLYVDLGNASVNSVANTLKRAGTAFASYNANFGRADFHVARIGVNYHF